MRGKKYAESWKSTTTDKCNQKWTTIIRLNTKVLSKASGRQAMLWHQELPKLKPLLKP